MAGSIQFTVRGPERWEAELDDLIQDVAKSPYATMLVGEVTRAAVLRIVVEEGIRAMRAKRMGGARPETTSSEVQPSEGGTLYESNP